MKKWFFVVMLLVVTSPVWAMFCQYCGKSMADDARFCPKCGKGNTVVLLPVGTPTAPAQEAVPALPTIQNEGFLQDYEPISRYEMLLTSTNTLPSSTKLAESRYQVTQLLARKGKELPSFSPVMAKGHALMVKKNDILDQYVDSWKRSFNGPMRAQGQAQREKLQFALTKVNEMISALKTGKNDQSILPRLDKQEGDLEEASREFQVTSSYVRVDNSKMNKGQTFWVAEIKNGWGRIVLMEPSNNPYPISGWVSLYDLIQRTTWRGEVPAVMYSSPVAPMVVYPPVQYEPSVVIVERDCWPWYGHRRHRDHGWGHGCRH